MCFVESGRKDFAVDSRSLKFCVMHSHILMIWDDLQVGSMYTVAVCVVFRCYSGIWVSWFVCIDMSYCNHHCACNGFDLFPVIYKTNQIPTGIMSMKTVGVHVLAQCSLPFSVMSSFGIYIELTTTYVSPDLNTLYMYVSYVC